MSFKTRIDFGAAPGAGDILCLGPSGESDGRCVLLFFFFMWHDVRINYDENRSKQLKTISRISTRMPADVGMAIGWELFFSLHVLMSGYFLLRPDLVCLTHLRTDLSHFWFLISFFCELTPDLNLREHFQHLQIGRASREREALPWKSLKLFLIVLMRPQVNNLIISQKKKIKVTKISP